MKEYIVEFGGQVNLENKHIHEEIMRCKDCCLQDDFKYCERLGFKVGDYGYCAWGERK